MKVITLARRQSAARTGIAFLAAAGLIGGAAAFAPHLAASHRAGIRQVSDVTSADGTPVIPSPAPGTAGNQSQGTICMFVAPAGAPLVGSMDAGHVGWAFRVSGDTFFYGATERADDTWIAEGTQQQMFHDFRVVGATADGQYYQQWRCTGTTGNDVSDAEAAAEQTATEGFFAPGNDCLDHAIQVLNSYSPGSLPLEDDDNFTPVPTDYFLSSLSVAGWGPVHDIPSNA